MEEDKVPNGNRLQQDLLQAEAARSKGRCVNESLNDNYSGIAWWSWIRPKKKPEMTTDRIDDEVRAAQRAYDEIAPRAVAQQELALSFWSRLINNSRAAVALATAGLGNQTAIVHRVSIEHFAFMYALVNGTWTREQVIQEAKFNNYEYAKALKVTLGVDDRNEREVLLPEAKKGLLAFLNDPSNKVVSAGVNVHNILAKEDLKFFHDTYRQLSLHAGHANAVSVSWEPSRDEMEHILTSVKELLDVATLLWRSKLGIKSDAAQVT